MDGVDFVPVKDGKTGELKTSAPVTAAVLELRWVQKALDNGITFSSGKNVSAYDLAHLASVVSTLQENLLGTTNPELPSEGMQGQYATALKSVVIQLQRKLGVNDSGDIERETLEAIQKEMVKQIASPTIGFKPKLDLDNTDPDQRDSQAALIKLKDLKSLTINVENSDRETELVNYKVALPYPNSTPQIDPNAGHVRGRQAEIISQFGLKDFARLNSKYFSSLDRNGDGTLTIEELNLASRDPRVAGEKAQYVVAITQNLDALDKLSSQPGVTCASLTQFGKRTDSYMQGQTNWKSFSKAEQNLAFELHNSLLNSAKILLTRDERVFVNGEQSVKSKYLEQGTIGNCYFHAALGAVADKDPKSIERMIMPYGNGLYIVRFPGAPNQPQVVTEPTDTELALYGNSGKSGLWAAILQKAYGQYLQNNSTDPDHSFGLYRNSYSTSDNGGYGGITLHLLTGKWPQYTFLKSSYEGGVEGSAVEQQLKMANLPNKFVTASSKQEEEPEAKNPAFMQGIVDTHEYQVMGYDEKTKMVTLRNPWGSTEWSPRADKAPVDGINDGVFQMPLSEFEKRFRRVTVNG